MSGPDDLLVVLADAGARNLVDEGPALRQPPPNHLVRQEGSQFLRSDRRTFLNEVLGAGVAVASTTLLAGCASVAGGVPATGAPTAGAPAAGGAATPPTAAATEWDMSWTRKLGRYKTAYDSPEIQDGAVLVGCCGNADAIQAHIG